MKENKVTFPNVLDPSQKAWEVTSKYETLGMSAVPMTYVIDREGKVVDAWYGFGENRIDEALKKLGLLEEEKEE